SFFYCESRYFLFHATSKQFVFCIAIVPPTAPQFGLSGCLFEGGYQFAIERRDIRHNSTPNLVAVTESRFIHPGGTGIEQVVFNSQRSNRLLACNNLRRNRQQPAMADDTDDLALLVNFGNQISGFFISSYLIWSPTTRQ